MQISFSDYFKKELCCRRSEPELVVHFSLLSVCFCKLGQRKLLGAANDLINWLWWLMTYILLRVSLSFEREIDVPRSVLTTPSLISFLNPFLQPPRSFC